MNKKNIFSQPRHFLQYGQWLWNSIDSSFIWSEELCLIFGLPIDEELTVERLKKFISPYDQDKIGYYINVVLETGVSQSCTFKLHKEEETRILSIKINIERENKQTVLFGIVQDVTEIYEEIKSSKYTNAFSYSENNLIHTLQLEAGQEQLIHISNSTLKLKDIGFLLIDRHYKCTYWDTYMEEITKVKKEHVLGKSIFKIFPEFKVLETELAIKEAFKGKAAQIKDKTYNNREEQHISLLLPIDQQSGGSNGVLFIFLRQIGENKYQSRNFVTEAFSAIPALIYIYDLKSNKTLYLNKNLATLVGQLSEIFDQSVSALMDVLVHPDDVEIVRIRNQKLGFLEPNEVVEDTIRIRHSDGKWRWINTRSTVLTNNDDSNSLTVLGLASDVTDSKLNEEKRIEQNTYIFDVVNSSPHLLYVYELPYGNIIYASRAVENILGYNFEELQKYGNDIVYHLINSDDHDKIRQHFLELSKATNQEMLEVVYRVKTAKNTCRWFKSSDRVYKRLSNSTPYRIIGAAVDITDEITSTVYDAIKTKEAKAVINSAEFSHRIVEATPDILFVYNIESKTEIFANRDVLELLGYTPKKNKISFLSEIIHHDDVLQVDKFLHQIKKNLGEFVDLELRCKDVKGSWRWMQVRSKVFRYTERGEVIEIIGIVRDITKKKKDEEMVIHVNEDLEKLVREQTKELVETEERYQLANSVTHDAIWDIDLVAETITFNDNYFSVFGYEPTNFRGKISDCYRYIHPDDTERVKKSLQQAVQEGKQYWQEEYRYRCKNGNYAFVLDRAIIKYEAEKAVRIVGAMADISKEKKAQEELKWLADELNLVLEAIPAMAWTAHPDGYRNYYNQRWYDYTGQSKEEATGWGWEMAHHPDDLPKTKEILMQCLYTGNDYLRENRIRRHDGLYRWHLVRARALRNEKNEIVRWVGTSTDIHDLKIAEEEKEQALSIANEKAFMLSQLNDYMDNFVHMAAHDLRAPLNNLMLAMELINKTDEIEKKIALTRTFESSLDRLNRTIEGMIDFIRIQNDTGQMVKLLHFDEILNIVMDDYKSQFEKSAGKLICNFKECRDIMYVEAYLLSIFKNLIGNALKYSNENRPPVIEISSKRVGKYIELSFNDNGIGMDLQKIGDQIFKPFRRFTSKAEGKGMGLNMIKSMIEKNNGFIKIESTPGEGSTFLCYLKEYL